VFEHCQVAVACLQAQSIDRRKGLLGCADCHIRHGRSWRRGRLRRRDAGPGSLGDCRRGDDHRDLLRPLSAARLACWHRRESTLNEQLAGAIPDPYDQRIGRRQQLDGERSSRRAVGQQPLQRGFEIRGVQAGTAVDRDWCRRRDDGE
jgi:hypothetical protein